MIVISSHMQRRYFDKENHTSCYELTHGPNWLLCWPGENEKCNPSLINCDNIFPLTKAARGRYKGKFTTFNLIYCLVLHSAITQAIVLDLDLIKLLK